MREVMDSHAPPEYYWTPLPPPLCRMSSFPNFEEEKRSGEKDTESGMRSKNAILDSKKNVNGVLEMKETIRDAEGEHDEGSEDDKEKGL